MDNNFPRRRCKELGSFEVVVLTYESAIWVRVLLAGGLQAQDGLHVRENVNGVPPSMSTVASKYLFTQ